MESRKACERVAKTLEQEMDQKTRLNKKNKVVEDGGRSFFDCHICLEMAREPIVTCCGHLFCQPCFYKLTYSSTTAKECPVCRGKVKDSAVTLICANDNSNRSFFDCHICSELMAREPIVTCCGHLFCWPCFCMLPYSSTTAKAKECPVCRGEVKDSALTPIYGNGNSKLVSGDGMVMIPPRPQAQRVESVRQNCPLLVETLQEQRQNVFAARTSPPSFHSATWSRPSTTRTFPPLIGGFLIFDSMDVRWDLEF